MVITSTTQINSTIRNTSSQNIITFNSILDIDSLQVIEKLVSASGAELTFSGNNFHFIFDKEVKIIVNSIEIDRTTSFQLYSKTSNTIIIKTLVANTTILGIVGV